MKKVSILALIISILIIGCNTLGTKGEVIIKTGIEKYTPAMSSTPGIPLTPEFKSKKPEQKVIYQWTTEQGRFLTWENSKVEEHSKEIKNEGGKVYWSVDFAQKEEKTPFEISLNVIDAKTGKKIAETKIRIDKTNDGFYTVKK